MRPGGSSKSNRSVRIKADDRCQMSEIGTKDKNTGSVRTPCVYFFIRSQLLSVI
jgi:hypothetical protein